MESHLKSIPPPADERKSTPTQSMPVRRRGAFLLPNLFTTASLFSGFYSIIAGINGHFALAAIAIFVSMVLDGLDGRVARLTDTATAFGAQYDSLSDLVAFGLAPALLVYSFCQRALETYGTVWAKAGWLLVFFYAVTTALRLARFNARSGTVGKRYFQGLPCPSAAALIAGLVWFSVSQGYSAGVYVIPALHPRAGSYSACRVAHGVEPGLLQLQGIAPGSPSGLPDDSAHSVAVHSGHLVAVGRIVRCISDLRCLGSAVVARSPVSTLPSPALMLCHAFRVA